MQIIAWVAQAIVFIIWLVMFFNTYNALRVRAEAEGQSLGTAFGGWLRSEEDRRDRRSLLMATIFVAVLFGLSFLTSGAR